MVIIYSCNKGRLPLDTKTISLEKAEGGGVILGTVCTGHLHISYGFATDENQRQRKRKRDLNTFLQEEHREQDS